MRYGRFGKGNLNADEERKRSKEAAVGDEHGAQDGLRRGSCEGETGCGGANEGRYR